MGRKKIKKKTKPKKTKKDKKAALSGGAKRGIIAVLLFGFATLVLLSLFQLTGVFGEYLNMTVRRLLGWGGFFAPLFFYILAFSYIKTGKTSVYRFAFVGLILFFLSFLGLLFFAVEPYNMIASAYEGEGGGYLGMILAYPLQYFLGRWGASVIFLILMAIGFIVTVNLSWSDLLGYWKDLFGKLVGKSSKKEERSLETTDIVAGDSKKEAATFNVRSIGAKKYEKALNSVRSNKKKSPELKGQQYRPDTTWKLPTSDLFQGEDTEPLSGDVEANAETIQETFAQFGIDMAMGDVSVGPTVTQYTMKPADGIKLTRITALADDLALSLAAHPIRIEAPIPGKSLVGVEIPNKETALVHVRNVLADKLFIKAKQNLALGLGRNVAGSVTVANLEKMPHLLVAGATGAGKSVCINTIITSLLYRNSPRQLKLIMVDPKRVELSMYNGVPHLLTPVITDPTKAVNALQWAIGEMDRRYRILEEAGSRNVFSYNDRTRDEEKKMPFIVIIVDELADLMAIKGKEVEGAIVRLAQMARAVGIHLIVSTQRPSVDVLTGLIKANIPTRIAFQVPTQIDSRTILDLAGAEKLLGNGDMLYLSNESKLPVRLQGAFISEEDVRLLVDFWVGQVKEKLGEDEADPVENIEIIKVQTGGASGTSGADGGGDGAVEGGDAVLYEKARALVVESRKASASFLQRRLRIGYARAARIIDMLEENGIVSPSNGSKPRDVLMNPSEQLTSYDDHIDDQQQREKWDDRE